MRGALGEESWRRFTRSRCEGLMGGFATGSPEAISPSGQKAFESVEGPPRGQVWFPDLPGLPFRPLSA
jgi:hypothetical protein